MYGKKGRKSMLVTFIFLCPGKDFMYACSRAEGTHTYVLEVLYTKLRFGGEKIKEKSFALKMHKVCDDP